MVVSIAFSTITLLLCRKKSSYENATPKFEEKFVYTDVPGEKYAKRKLPKQHSSPVPKCIWYHLNTEQNKPEKKLCGCDPDAIVKVSISSAKFLARNPPRKVRFFSNKLSQEPFFRALWTR